MRNVRQSIGGLGNLMFKQAYLIGKALDGEVPDVYVQSERYWKQHAEQVKAIFSEGINPNKKVALHIRRGDYINNSFYVNLWETDYYKKAIALFPGDKFIVFCRDNQDWNTDKADRQWCRENLTPLLEGRFELPPKENTEIDDFNLMAGCKARIGANSSFSWWACYLGSGMNVMPKQWYADEIERTECPEEWIRL